MDMQGSIALLLLALGAGCASDVDLHLGLEGQSPDGGGVSTSIGTLRAVRVLSGPGEVQVTGVVWHPASLVVVGGHFNGMTDLGAGPVGSGTHHTGFVAAYDPSSGDPIWSRAFTGSTATDASYQLTTSGIIDVAIATDGTIHAVGSFGRTIDFGTGPIESTDGCHDGVVGRYAADGSVMEPFVLPRSPLLAVAAMPDGGLVTSGYEQTGDCPALEGGPPFQRFVARLDSQGMIAWKLALGTTPHIEKIATSPAGDILLLGTLSETVTIGDLSVTGVDPRVGDSFLARLSPEGVPQWLVSCVRTTLEGQCSPAGDVTFTAEGRVLASASFERRVNLAGAIIESGRPDTRRVSTYVAELGDEGEPTVLAVIDSVLAHGIDVRTDPFELLLAGQGMSMDPKGPYLGVLADASTLVSARGMSAPELSWGIAWDVAAGPAGEIALVGDFHGDADFGAGPVRAETDEEDVGDDGFVAIYDRDVAESVR